MREALRGAQTEAQELGVPLGVQLQYKIKESGRFWDADTNRTQRLEMHTTMLADDIAAVCGSARGLAVYMAQLEAACQKWSLVISTSKTECMLVNGAG